MSFKAVELQIAVPRTSEAGRYQNEAQQRPVTDQNLLAEQMTKEAKVASQRSEAMAETSHTSVREDHSSGGNHHSGADARDGAEGEEEIKPAEHPYKGKHIDLSV